METCDLISLVVDYEVPPSLIIAAISDGRLKPIITEDGPPRLETVAFPRHQVENSFWAYSLKYKDYELRTELARRIHRYDGIVSGIIGAVVGSGVTAAASLAAMFWEDAPKPTDFPKDFGGEEPPDFAIPVLPPYDRFTYKFMRHQLTVSHEGSFALTASADGIAVDDCPQEGHVTLRHERAWETHYSDQFGGIRALVTVGTRVAQGDPVVEILATRRQPAQGRFGIFRKVRTGKVKPLHLAHLPWSILPTFQP